jgi:uncharacterized protein
MAESELQQKLNDDLKQSLRDRNEVKTSTLRLLISAIRYAEIKKQETEYAHLAAAAGKKLDEEFYQQLSAAGKKPVEFTDKDILDVVAKEIKQRQDSVEAYKKGGRQDLVDRESAELEILKSYGPKQMSRDEILVKVKQIIAETGAKGPSDKAKVMPKIMAELKGKADGREINNIVTELLNS